MYKLTVMTNPLQICNQFVSRCLKVCVMAWHRQIYLHHDFDSTKFWLFNSYILILILLKILRKILILLCRIYCQFIENSSILQIISSTECLYFICIHVKFSNIIVRSMSIKLKLYYFLHFYLISLNLIILN